MRPARAPRRLPGGLLQRPRRRPPGGPHGAEAVRERRCAALAPLSAHRTEHRRTCTYARPPRRRPRPGDLHGDGLRRRPRAVHARRPAGGRRRPARAGGQAAAARPAGRPCDPAAAALPAAVEGRCAAARQHCALSRPAPGLQGRQPGARAPKRAGASGAGQRGGRPGPPRASSRWRGQAPAGAPRGRRVGAAGCGALTGAPRAQASAACRTPPRACAACCWPRCCARRNCAIARPGGRACAACATCTPCCSGSRSAWQRRCADARSGAVQGLGSAGCTSAGLRRTSGPAAAHAVLDFCVMRPCPPPASPAWLGRPGTQHCSPAGGRAAGAPAAAQPARRAGRTRGGRALRRIAGWLRTGPAAPHVRGARPLPSALDASGAAPARAAVAVHAPGGHAYHWQGRWAHGAGKRTAPLAHQEEWPVSEHVGERSALLWAAWSRVPQRCPRGGLQCARLRVQVDESDPLEDAARRHALLPLALAAVEAALRRAPEALGRSDRHVDECAQQARSRCDRSLPCERLRRGRAPVRGRGPAGRPVVPDAAASAQAVANAIELLRATGPVRPVPPAARALLATLAKLLAKTHVPGAAVCTGLTVRRAAPCTPPGYQWRHAALAGCGAQARAQSHGARGRRRS